MRRKRLREQPKENLDRWMVSYADFVTLLLAFFIVLYGISSVNEGKYRVLSDAMSEIFKKSPRSMEPIQVGQISRSQSTSPIEKSMPADATEQPVNEDTDELKLNLKEMADEIEVSMKALIDEELVKVRRSNDWLEIEINDSILFPSGSSNLVGASTPVLQEIAAVLKQFPNPINVEGFTDNVPISTPAYPSNWELSAARAASVVHLFTKAGVRPERLSAIGYGQFRPIAENTTAEGRNQNRRVVLAVLAEDINITLGRGRQQEQTDVQQGTGFPALNLMRR